MWSNRSYVGNTDDGWVYLDEGHVWLTPGEEYGSPVSNHYLRLFQLSVNMVSVWLCSRAACDSPSLLPLGASPAHIGYAALSAHCPDRSRRTHASVAAHRCLE